MITQSVTVKKDFSFSLLSDLNQQETSFPNMVPLSLSTVTTPCPSPPVHVTAAPMNTKLPGIRARKLRLSLSHPEQLSRKDLAPQTTSAATETEPTSERHLARATYSPHPPPKSYPCEEPVISRYGNNNSYFLGWFLLFCFVLFKLLNSNSNKDTIYLICICWKLY